MAIRNDLVLLSARGCQLPSDETSRLGRLTVSGGDRYVVSFTDEQEGIFTFPELPSSYQGGTLVVELVAIASVTTGTAGFTVAVEAVTPGDSVDLDSATSFDTSNAGTGSIPATAGNPFTITVTLTNKDSAAAGDHLRLKVVRDDSAGGTIQLLGGKLYEDVTVVDLSDADTVQVDDLVCTSIGGVALATYQKVYKETLTNPSANTVTITHNLNNQYPTVVVYDESDKQILVDEVTATSVNVITLDKTSYGTVTGNWKVTVVG